MNALVYRPNAEVEVVEVPEGAAQADRMREIIGGWLGHGVLFFNEGRSIDFWCDEEGDLKKDLDVSVLVQGPHYHPTVIRGPCIITAGVDDDDGRIVAGLTDEEIAAWRNLPRP